MAEALSDAWVGDFWEHAAVIRELARHPLHPDNPVLAVSAPHALSSPYALALALLTRGAGIDSFQILSAAALFNLALFGIAFRAFIGIFYTHWLVPVLALLFTLVLWGRNPLAWSGFYHLQNISDVMPYPSTFALSLTFISLSLANQYFKSGRLQLLLPLPLLVFTTVLTHPLTAIFLACGLISLTVWFFARQQIRRIVVLAVVVTSGLLASVAWPYYPLLALVFAEGSAYNTDSIQMYSDALPSIFPALLGLPIIAERWLRARRDPLATILVLLTLVYVYGFLENKFAYGRVISQIALILQLALSGWLASKLRNFNSNSWPAHWCTNIRLVLTCLSIVFVFGHSLPSLHAFASKVWHLNRTTTLRYRFQFLAEFLHDDDVVMADAATALYVPAWGGKVVAWPFALPFIVDRETRTRDVATFFASGTDRDTRDRVAESYAAKWVLMDLRNGQERAAEASIMELGQEVYTDRDGSLVLIRLRPT